MAIPKVDSKMTDGAVAFISKNIDDFVAIVEGVKKIDEESKKKAELTKLATVYYLGYLAGKKEAHERKD